jgi:transcription initiation factor TFIID TATA-box-binding protein
MKVKPEDSLKIENIVASAKVSDFLDLADLASKIPDAEYNKKRFPGVVLRMQDPKIAALVFGSGKLVLTGAKSIESLGKGLEILGSQLRSLGIKIPGKLTYKIQNIVTSADLHAPINLNKIAVGFNLERIEYEADRFAVETIDNSRSLIDALKKLYATNLSNLTPHPFTSSSIERGAPGWPSAVVPDSGVGCIPVIATIELSRITRTNLAPLYTEFKSPWAPE